MPIQTKIHLRKWGGFLLALVCGSFFFAAPYHRPLNNPNEGVRIFMVKALVDHGTFAIDDVIKKWGNIDDKARRDKKMYSSKAPLMSIFGAAAYGLAYPITGPLERKPLTILCRRAANALPCALLLIFFSFLLRRRMDSPFLWLLSIVGLGCGTHLLAYVHVFSGHSLAALACGICFLLAGDKELLASYRWPSIAFGTLGVVAVGTEYPAFLAVIPCGILWLFNCRVQILKQILRCLAGMAVPSLLVAISHHAMFGAPWQTGYSFLENQNYNTLHSHGFFGISAPHLDVLTTVLFSPEIGLFFFMPILALGLLALPFFLWKENDKLSRSEVICLGMVTLGLLAFIAGHRGWRGGWVVGPRYISELAVLLFIPAILWMDQLAKKRFILVGIFTTTLVILGMVHSGLPGLFFPHLSEAYKNPVYELVLPLIALGFSPDTWILDLGGNSMLSSRLVLILFALPLLALAFCEDSMDARKKNGSIILGSIVLAILVIFCIQPILPRTNGRVIGQETRHLYDMWRPSTGNPFLEGKELKEVSPSIQLALDHGKRAFNQWPDSFCPKDTSLVPNDLAPLGPIFEALTSSWPNGEAPKVWIVDDRLAHRIAPALLKLPDLSAVLIAERDLRDLPQGDISKLPCTGSIGWVAHLPIKTPPILQPWLKTKVKGHEIADHRFVTFRFERPPRLRERANTRHLMTGLSAQVKKVDGSLVASCNWDEDGCQYGDKKWEKITWGRQKFKDRSRHCLFAHPTDKGILEIEMGPLPKGDYIRFGAGLTRRAVSGAPPVNVRVTLDDKEILKRSYKKRSRWRHNLIEAPTEGKKMRVFIQAKKIGRKFFCLKADVLEAKNKPTPE